MIQLLISKQVRAGAQAGSVRFASVENSQEAASSLPTEVRGATETAKGAVEEEAAFLSCAQAPAQ